MAQSGAAAKRPTLREQVDNALRTCVPWAQGLMPGKAALVQMSGSASNFLYRVDARAADGTSHRLCLRRAQHGLGVIPHSAEAELMLATRKKGAVVPEVHGVLPAGDALGSGFFMAWVDGEGRGEKIAGAFAKEERGRWLGQQCGDSLARIQSVPVDELPRVPKGPSTPLRYLVSLRKQYDSFRVCRPALEYAFAWLEKHAPAEDANESVVLVHGDFRSANIMAHPEKGLAGIIDWEMAHTGNRYEDAGWICVRAWRYGVLQKPVGGFAMLQDFCEGYEAAGGAPLDHTVVWWWALAGSVRWAVLCLQQGVAFQAEPARFESGVVGRRTCEGELDCLVTLAEAMGGVEAVLATVRSLEPSSSIPEPDAGFPSAAELVAGARQMLSGQILPSFTATGDERNAFLVRVVNNALGMVLRSLHEQGPLDLAEASALAESLEQGPGGSLPELRLVFAKALRNGALGIEGPEVLGRLLQITAWRTRVDQPKYPSLKELPSKL